MALRSPDRYRFLGLIPVPQWCAGLPGVVRDIHNQENGTLYLRRVYLLPRVWLHNIAQADSDLHLHDHPWEWATARVLSGGYTERVPFGTRQYRRGDVNQIRKKLYHSIVHVQPNTWTLFRAGPRTGDWGFLVAGRNIPHKEYFELRK